MTHAAVPAHLRPWTAPWPDYTPADATPDALQPAALADNVPFWAEPALTPADIDSDEWHRRQEAALVRYQFDPYGRPLNPAGRTGRTGRNLGKWGENAAADPIVLAGTGTDRHVLLIRRDDIGVWAIPGGMVDPGETAPATLTRELREETGVDLADHTPTILTRGVVDDWRNTDHAWVASTAALYRLPARVAATAGDDAADAAWWPAADIPALAEAVAAAGGELYDAHLMMLAQALDRADAIEDQPAAPAEGETHVTNINTGVRGIQAANVDNATVVIHTQRGNNR